MASASDGWQTPPWLLERVRSIGPIGLDPATSSENPTGAERFIAPPDDGLADSWETRAGTLVFVNPPFSVEFGEEPRSRPWLRGKEQSQVHAWLRRAIRAAERSPVFFLAPFGARIEMASFQAAFRSRRLSGVWFPSGRVSYVDPETGVERKGPNFPSMAFLFGIHFDTARRALDSAGALLRPANSIAKPGAFSPFDADDPGAP